MLRSHYVSLAFADDAGRTRSIVMKSARKAVTAPLIREALNELDMNENATLLSACWMGKMSDPEYANGVNQPSFLRMKWLLAAILTLLLALASTWLWSVIHP